MHPSSFCSVLVFLGLTSSALHYCPFPFHGVHQTNMLLKVKRRLMARASGEEPGVESDEEVL